MLDAVTKTLINYLHTETPDLDNSGGRWIVENGLFSDNTTAADKLNVCLYAIDEHPHLRNRPMERTDAGLIRPALAVRLHYLVTYVSDDQEQVAARLGRVLQAFHSKRRFVAADLNPQLRHHVRELVIGLRNPTADERNEIWSALSRAMRLSLYYTVDAAPITPLAQDGAGEVQALTSRAVGAVS